MIKTVIGGNVSRPFSPANKDVLNPRRPLVRFGEDTDGFESKLSGQEAAVLARKQAEEDAFLARTIVSEKDKDNQAHRWTGLDLLRLAIKKQGVGESYIGQLSSVFSPDNQPFVNGAYIRMGELGLVATGGYCYPTEKGREALARNLQKAQTITTAAPGRELPDRNRPNPDRKVSSEARAVKLLVTAEAGLPTGWDLLKEVARKEAGQAWYRPGKGVAFEELAAAYPQQKPVLAGLLQALRQDGLVREGALFSDGKADLKRIRLTGKGRAITAFPTLDAYMASDSAKPHMQGVIALRLEDYRRKQTERDQFLKDLESRGAEAEGALQRRQDEQAALEQEALGKSDGRLALQAQQMTLEIASLRKRAARLEQALRQARLDLREQAAREQEEILALQEGADNSEMLAIYERYMQLVDRDPGKQKSFEVFLRDLGIQTEAGAVLALGLETEAAAGAGEAFSRQAEARALAKLRARTANAPAREAKSSQTSGPALRERGGPEDHGQAS